MKRLICWSLAVIAVPSSLLAQTGTRAPARKVPRSPRDSALAATPKVIDSTYHLGFKQLGAGLAVIALAATVDVPIANGFQGPASSGTLSTARQFDRFGDLTGAVPILGGLAVASLVSHNRKLGKMTLRAAASAAFAAAAAQGIKRVTGRMRPVDDPDLDAYDFHFFTSNQAFPSGHTAAAFALATSLSDDINSDWARLGLYALAGGTGWARMAEREHWFSDVVGGAVLGYLSAKFASGRIRVFGLQAPRFLLSSNGVGVTWTLGRIGN